MQQIYDYLVLQFQESEFVESRVLYAQLTYGTQYSEKLIKQVLESIAKLTTVYPTRDEIMGEKFNPSGPYVAWTLKHGPDNYFLQK